VLSAGQLAVLARHHENSHAFCLPTSACHDVEFWFSCSLHQQQKQLLGHECSDVFNFLMAAGPGASKEQV